MSVDTHIIVGHGLVLGEYFGHLAEVPHADTARVHRLRQGVAIYRGGRVVEAVVHLQGYSHHINILSTQLQ